MLFAFDLYGTLLDVSGLASRMRPLLGRSVAKAEASVLLARWRKAQLERSWRLNREGRYEPWDRVTVGALEEVAPGISAETRGRLSDLWRTVPAYSDASPTLSALKQLGARRAILSNGTRAMIAAALAESSLEADVILSADDVGVYKTDPRVYALLDAEAPRGRALFVSANAWDVAGAKRDGRKVLWIDRGGGETPNPPPDHRLSSLSELLQLGGRS